MNSTSNAGFGPVLAVRSLLSDLGIRGIGPACSRRDLPLAGHQAGMVAVWGQWPRGGTAL